MFRFAKFLYILIDVKNMRSIATCGENVVTFYIILLHLLALFKLRLNSRKNECCNNFVPKSGIKQSSNIRKKM